MLINHYGVRVYGNRAEEAKCAKEDFAVSEMINVNPLADSNSYTFETGTRAVLKFLQHRLGFDLWMVTRAEGTNWIVLQAECQGQADGKGYGLEPDAVFQWSDSYCSQMVEGKGPCIAPRSEAVPAYLAAPMSEQVRIGAYVGVPLVYGDGTLFGTLCALHPTPKPESVTTELPLIELLASMLSGLLKMELAAAEAERRAESAQVEAETDVLTGLCNRRAWNRLVAAEEVRCQRYGHPACVMMVDLDGLKAMNDAEGHPAGDRLIRRTAEVIRASTRVYDTVARLGGDEFGILGIECKREQADVMSRRLRNNLEAVGIFASQGLAMRMPAKGIQHAWEEADREMYLDKARMARSRFIEETVFPDNGHAAASGDVAASF